MPNPPTAQAAAIALTKVPRPAGQAAHYRFVTDTRGRMFKGAHGATTAPSTGDPVLVVSVSQVDADGHALVDALGTPLVLTHSHTFTATELADPAFDVEARVDAIMVAAVGAIDQTQAARQAIADLTANWPALPGLGRAPGASLN